MLKPQAKGPLTVQNPSRLKNRWATSVTHLFICVYFLKVACALGASGDYLGMIVPAIVFKDQEIVNVNRNLAAFGEGVVAAAVGNYP